MRWICSSVAAVVLCLLGSVGGAASDERKPNDFERAYTALALDMESHETCAKISSRALVRAPFNSPGTRLYFQRSYCFQLLAQRTLNPYFCRSVRPASDSASEAGHFTRETCESLIAKGQSFRADLSFDHALILQALGYTDADVARRFPKHSEEPSWSRFYHDFFRRSDGTLQQRLKDLPDFSDD